MNATGPESSLHATRGVVRDAVVLVRKVLQRWVWLVVALAIGAVAALVAPRIIKPQYKSETVLLYREVIQAGTVLDPGYQAESRRQMGPRLREMVLSRSNLERIITDQNLYPDIVKGRGMLDAVDQMRLNVEFRIRDGDTFSLSFTGEDPALVYAVTKKLADSLIDQVNRYRLEEAQSTKAFLETEQKRTGDQLRAKEEELARFLAQHPEFAQDTASMAGQTVGASVRAAERRGAAAGIAMDAATQALERQAMRLRQQLRAPGSAPAPGAPSPPAMDAESAAAIARAEENLASARNRLAELQARFTPQHPDVQAAQARVQEAQAALNQARAAARTTTPAEPAAASVTNGASRADLENQLARVEAAIAAKKRGASATTDAAPADEGNWIVALETEWASLNREVAEMRERNQQIQSRLFRASIIASVEANDAATKMVVVDPAFEPTRPFTKGKRRTGAIAAALVFVLGLGVAFLASLFDDRVYDEVDLRRLGIGKLAHAIPSSSPPKKGKRNG